MIYLKSNYGFEIIVEDGNAKISIDIEDRIYSKLEDGKTDFTKPPLRDISDESFNEVVKLLDDMAYYRKRDFDSTDLIESLISKLPCAKIAVLAAKLKAETSCS